MKGNWSALGVMIAVLFLGASILTAGFIINAQVSTLKQWFKKELTIAEVGIKEELTIAKLNIRRDIIAEGYAFSKANSEKRAVILEDLNEGYALARKLME